MANERPATSAEISQRTQQVSAIVENRVRAVQLAIDASRGQEWNEDQIKALYRDVYSFLMEGTQ